MGITSLAECQSKIISLQAEIAMLVQANKELKYLNDTLRDEYNTSQLTCSSLEEKLRKVQVCIVCCVLSN